MSGYTYAPDAELSDEDRQAIDAVCLDYAEGWFDADVERMGRSLHPELDKRGLVRRVVDARHEFIAPEPISRSRMLELTGAGVGRMSRDDRTIQVEILAAKHHLASARIELGVMTDLLHLMRFPDGWKIVHSIWTLAGGVIANSTTDA